MKNENTFRPTCHVDGTVTVWDPRRQSWLRHVKPHEISERILASLSPSERQRVLRHKEIGVYVTPRGNRVILRRLTKEEEMDFYRRTGGGPVMMTLRRPKPEAQQDQATETPKE